MCLCSIDKNQDWWEPAGGKEEPEVEQGRDGTSVGEILEEDDEE